MAGAAGHRPCGGVLVLGRIECTTGPHWRGINGLAERKDPGALETRVQRIVGQFEASWLGSLGRLGWLVIRAFHANLLIGADLYLAGPSVESVRR
jgi:hypothetical protein